MKRTIQVSVRRGESKYVAECIGLPVVTQADTLGELARNISEAIALFLEDEDLSEFQLAPQPVVVATLELDLAACSASDQAVAMSGRTPGGVESHFACPRLTPGALGDWNLG